MSRLLDLVDDVVAWLAAEVWPVPVVAVPRPVVADDAIRDTTVFVSPQRIAPSYAARAAATSSDVVTLVVAGANEPFAQMVELLEQIAARLIECPTRQHTLRETAAEIDLDYHYQHGAFLATIETTWSTR